MADVILLGQPFWATKIATAINRQATGLSASFEPEARYLSLLARSPARNPTILMRVGYRTGGSTLRARAFDAFWSLLRRSYPRAARAHYWIGTDVIDTLRERDQGSLRTAALAASREDLHIAQAEWLAEELRAVGISPAAVIDIPMDRIGWDETPSLPSEFRVLTYIGEHRFAFYGGPEVVRAAAALPDVSFDVVGSRAVDADGLPPNIQWHGWTSQMAEFYRRAAVVIRIPQHDGLGATVVEALLFARAVVYNYPVPHTFLLEPVTDEGLLHVLTDLKHEFEAGRYALNLDGRDYARRSFDRRVLGSRLVSVLQDSLAMAERR